MGLKDISPGNGSGEKPGLFVFIRVYEVVWGYGLRVWFIGMVYAGLGLGIVGYGGGLWEHVG